MWEMIVGFSQDDCKRGSHRVGEHFHGGLYSSIVIKWLFRTWLPHAERSFYLLMITTESDLGLLFRTTLLKGAT